MLRPRRFDQEFDPGPVQIQARKVAFDLSGVPLEWIPTHPVSWGDGSRLTLDL
jgi:uncharacterized protein